MRPLSALRRLGRALLSVWYRGQRRSCPLCGGSFRAFRPQGRRRRPDAKCPRCGSLERHRLVWLYLRERSGVLGGRALSMLHIAPERPLEERLRRAPALRYVTSDLEKPASVRMDVTRMGLPDGTFDVVYCSHVLEHVPDDRAALRELRRVLAPGGEAILSVPITAERTVEDPTIMDPAERRRLFGQHDHVRRYGPDFEDRLARAGFRARRLSALELVSAEEAERYGLREDEPVWLCTSGQR